MKKQVLKIREIKTRKIVHEVDVTGRNENRVEKVMKGMLINMNRDEYFIDDEEAYKEE